MFVKSGVTLFLTLLLYAQVAFCQTSQEAVQKSPDFKAQLLSLEQETQLQISALSDQSEKLDANKREEIDLKIIELKRQAEISRLTILLNWANAESDQARAAEIQKALDNWINPPPPQLLPTRARDINTPSPQDTQDKNSKASPSGNN